jgi:hypothetical protein
MGRPINCMVGEYTCSPKNGLKHRRSTKETRKHFFFRLKRLNGYFNEDSLALTLELPPFSSSSFIFIISIKIYGHKFLPNQSKEPRKYPLTHV